MRLAGLAPERGRDPAKLTLVHMCLDVDVRKAAFSHQTVVISVSLSDREHSSVLWLQIKRPRVHMVWLTLRTLT